MSNAPPVGTHDSGSGLTWYFLINSAGSSGYRMKSNGNGGSLGLIDTCFDHKLLSKFVRKPPVVDWHRC